MAEQLEEGLAVYDGHDRASFEEHLERYGHGPHEFETTEAGVGEVDRPVYGAYARALGR